MEAFLYLCYNQYCIAINKKKTKETNHIREWGNQGKLLYLNNYSIYFLLQHKSRGNLLI